MLAARMAQPRLFGGARGAARPLLHGPSRGPDRRDRVRPARRRPRFRLLRRSRAAATCAAASPSRAEAQQRHGLLNLRAWPDNPTLGDPAHRSAILSLAYLSLAAPGLGRLLAPEAIRRKHLEDGVAAMSASISATSSRGCPRRCARRRGSSIAATARTPRLPGFFIRNEARRYALFYHAEQAPNPDSTVRLTERARRARPAAAQDRSALQRDRRALGRRQPRDHRPQPARSGHRPARIHCPRRRAARPRPGPGDRRLSPDRHDPHGGRPGRRGRRPRLPRPRHAEPVRRQQRGVPDLRPGQPDPADRGAVGAARGAPRPRLGGFARSRITAVAGRASPCSSRRAKSLRRLGLLTVFSPVPGLGVRTDSGAACAAAVRPPTAKGARVEQRLRSVAARAPRRPRTLPRVRSRGPAAAPQPSRARRAEAQRRRVTLAPGPLAAELGSLLAAVRPLLDGDGGAVLQSGRRDLRAKAPRRSRANSRCSPRPRGQRRTLLIDADRRNPQTARSFDCDTGARARRIAVGRQRCQRRGAADRRHAAFGRLPDRRARPGAHRRRRPSPSSTIACATNSS